ncbi:MAG: ribosomal protein S18-alanine N-acetyltransferase [Janthinobacterium lividum]
MHSTDIDEVLDIELAAYPFPWVRDNFVDSLHSGYQCWVARDAQHHLLGYYLMMVAVDEAHLLNITVHVHRQGQGAGLQLLDHASAQARELGMASMLLEVRPSNTRALAIYQRYGFRQIGLRRNYYPAAQQQREDAIVMRLPL